MARKPFSTTPVAEMPAPAPARTSEVRNTPVPRQPGQAPKAQITQEMIARRAFEIWKSGKGGNATENWLRAERELRTQN